MCKTCRGKSRKVISSRYEGSGRRRNRYRDDPDYKRRADASVAKYRLTHPEEIAAAQRAKHRAVRQAVITLYGGHCACCGEIRWQFLALDHVNGGGNRHRKLVSTTTLYWRLAKAGVAESAYRLLCHNCNAAIGFYGECPHEAERKAVA